MLVATKQLLETLTQWSRGLQTETDVSDVYVRLGYEFNIASRAFTQVGIDTSDLGPVPDTLRTILEETLSQEASQASLDKFLPRIRDIIINLLHGLKRKQQKLRTNTGRDGSSGSSSSSGGSVQRQASLASTLSFGDENLPARDTHQYPKREGSKDLAENRVSLHHPTSGPGTNSPQRQDSSATKEPRRSGSAGRATHDYPVPSEPPPPYPQEIAVPGPPSNPPTQSLPEPPREANQPPKPPPKHQDALAALQRGGELERRASRRFSQYQISKQLGTSTAGVPMIPPAQRSPIPNRGRDIRESMNAVKSRGSQIQRSRSRHGGSRSPERKVEPITNIRQSLRDNGLDSNVPNFAPPTETDELGSPHVKTPDDKYRKDPGDNEPSNQPGMRATITKPWDDSYPIPEVIEPEAESAEHKDNISVPFAEPEKSTTPPKERENDVVAARQSVVVEPLILFLQYKTHIKKLVLPGGFEELTMPRLQLAFIEKFSWHAHSNNAELPEIYVQDQVSGVRHELEDLNDVKNHSVLVLNVDNVNEVKRHIDDSMVGMKAMLETIKSSVAEQAASIQLISTKQQDTARDIKRFSSTPSRPVTTQGTPNGVFKGTKTTQSQLEELQSLRRELAVLRQTHTSQMTSMEAAMVEVRDKATAAKESASSASVTSAAENGRGYVNSGKKQLSDDSENIINRVDDLQDLVEDLRKDVFRGVRPLPRQLEGVSKDITTATTDLQNLRQWLQQEKPKWKKISEDELKQIMDDQEVLNVQEELFTDLEDDLQKASDTFTLVEQASKQQTVQSGSSGSTRSTSRTLNTAPDVDPVKAKDTVMGEVRALQPNHESRLEAIERAEKARKIELDNRAQNAFKKELGDFVEESKLKKTGGVEEAERLRLKRDEDARKENFQRMAERRARQEAEAAAEAAAPAAVNDESTSVADNPPQLSVPGFDDGGNTSPEPEFLEAQESPLAAAVS